MAETVLKYVHMQNEFSSSLSSYGLQNVKNIKHSIACSKAASVAADKHYKSNYMI